MALPRLTDQDRRARVARRHALSPAHRVGTPEAATDAMTVLHATEAATVHLAIAARTNGVSPTGVDAALHDDRSLVKQHAMRSTLFVFPRDLLPAAWGSAAAREAAVDGRRIAKRIEAAGIARDGEAWLAVAAAAVLERLAIGPATLAVLRAELPELAGTAGGTTEKRWDRPVSVAPWVVGHLGLLGEVLRGVNQGHWRTSRPQWVRTLDWLGEPASPLTADAGYCELVRRWLGTFGPGTLDDVAWWLGATRTAVRRALGDVAAVEVALDDGTTGWVLPGDEAPVEPEQPWAALLPTLDPTTMGWKERGFYLDPRHRPHLFDTNGNAGTTAWWDGRIVGCWVQGEAGRVRVSLVDDVGTDGRRALEEEAERLTSWLDGVVITNVYTTRQMRQARLP